MCCRELELQRHSPHPQETILAADERRQWIEEKGALVYTVLSADGMIQIDTFLDNPLPFAELKRNAGHFEINGHRFTVSD